MAENIPLPGEFDDNNDFWQHPKYSNWEANRIGIVRHVKNKKDVGNLTNTGYLKIAVIDNGIKKDYIKHRFIYECFHGLINDAKLVVDHINNISTDNRLENLQLITQSENMKKENPKGECLPPIRVRAINIVTGESSDYDSLKKCSKDLDIDRSSITKVLKGITKTAFSKLDKNKYTFEKLNCETDTTSIKVRALNLATGKSADYNSIGECSSRLDINNASIRHVLKGRQQTAKSKKDNCKYTFEKMI